MSGRAVFRCGLVLAGFVMGACSVAEAKIPSSRQMGTVPDVAYSNMLTENLGQTPAAPCQESSGVTRTVKLDFGPLHFQEILTSTPRSCRS